MVKIYDAKTKQWTEEAGKPLSKEEIMRIENEILQYKEKEEELFRAHPPVKPIEERVDDVETLAEMAYINSEYAAVLSELALDM